MTNLLARVRRLGVPVTTIAADSDIKRGSLSNAMYGRRGLSPAASARVEATLDRLERQARIQRLAAAVGSAIVEDYLAS